MPRGRKNAPASPAEPTKDPQPLKDEVREALLLVMRDADSPAGARASAARTLLEHYADVEIGEEKASDELTEAELEAEIARLGKR